MYIGSVSEFFCRIIWVNQKKKKDPFALGKKIQDVVTALFASNLLLLNSGFHTRIEKWMKNEIPSTLLGVQCFYHWLGHAWSFVAS